MTNARVTAATATALLATLALAGCGGVTPGSASPGGAPSSPTAQVSMSPTPATSDPASSDPASPAAPASVIPTDCRKLVDAQKYASVFGDTPLNDPAVVGAGEAGVLKPKTSSAAASVQQILDDAIQLRCVWRNPAADVTYLEATVATVDVVTARQYLQSLPGSGYTCTDANSGRQCQRIQPDPEYPVDDADTSYLRDNVYIYVGQANFPTNNLMGAIVSTIWG